MERSRHSADRESQDLEHMPLLGFKCRVPWGSWTKARLVNSKELGFGKPRRNLIEEVHRTRHWEAGMTIDHSGCWGSHIRNLHLLVTLQVAL